MPWEGFTIWFLNRHVDGALRTLGDAAVLSGQSFWASWRVHASPDSAMRELALIKDAGRLPDVALVDVDSAPFFAMLTQRAQEAGKRCTAYEIYSYHPNGGATVEPARELAMLLEKAAESTQDVARCLLHTQVEFVPFSSETRDRLREFHGRLEEASLIWRDAQEKLNASKARIEAILRRKQEAHSQHRSVFWARNLKEADSPSAVRMLLEEMLGAAAPDLLRQCESDTSSTDTWWAPAVTAARAAAAEVSSMLEDDLSLYQLWRLVPFEAQRLWSERGSANGIEIMCHAMRSICEFLDSTGDYTLALARLLKTADVNGNRVPVTIFAHGMHGWSYQKEFEEQFGIPQPRDTASLEELMRASLYNAPQLCARGGRVALPLDTIRRLEADADRVLAFGSEEKFNGLASSTIVGEEWCVWPARYLRASWPALGSCPITVAGFPENGEEDFIGDVVTDWRRLKNLVERIFKQVPAPPSAVDVIYADDGTTVTLVFTLAVVEYLDGLRLERLRGGLTGTLREFLQWCLRVSFFRNKTTGECFKAVGPRFEWEPTDTNTKGPFAKLELTLGHYNNTRKLI